MITPQLIEKLYPRARDEVKWAFSRHAEALFAEFGVGKTRMRTEFFLAQVGHESTRLAITVENMNYSAKRMMQAWPSRFPTLAAAQPYERNAERLGNNVYANRMGNGDSASGDGYRFRGRGFIQITGREGYREVGHLAGLDLVANPDRAAATEDALRVACAFWRWKDLNAVCDTGNFIRSTERINGGRVGLEDRLAWLNKVRRAFAETDIPATQPDAATVRAVQLALRERGHAGIGAADGLLGPRTAEAIRRFRIKNELGAGLIDAALLDLLDLD